MKNSSKQGLAVILALALMVLVVGLWQYLGSSLRDQGATLADVASIETKPDAPENEGPRRTSSLVSTSGAALATDDLIAAPSKPVTRDILVRCIDKDSRRPVGPIDLYVWSSRDLPASAFHNAQGIAFEMQTYGRRYRADEEGHCRLPLQSLSMWVGASSERHIGRVWLAAARESGEIELELVPERWLDVKVVDASGQSRGGADLRLVAMGKTSHYVLEVVALRASTTEGGGTCRLSLGALASVQQPYDQVRVVLEGFFDPEIAFTFDATEPLTEVITLAMPPVGAIRARVLFDPDERPADGEYWIRVQEIVSSGQVRASKNWPLAAGEARAQQLALGRNYCVVLDSLDSSAHWESRMVVAGPQTAGEEVEVIFDLRGQQRRGRLMGRLFDPDGHALAEVDLVITLDPGAGKMFTTTDPEGQIDLPLPETTRGRSISSLSFSCHDPRHAGLVAQWIVNSSESPDLDFGLLDMNRRAAAVTGKVVDDLGQGISEARVLVAGPDWNEALVIPPQGTPVHSAADGSFAVYDSGPGDAFTLVVIKDGHARGFRRCRVGELDVQIVMPRLARLRGRFLVEGGGISTQFSVRLVAADNPDFDHDLLQVSDSGVLDRMVKPGNSRVVLRSRATKGDIVWQSEVLSLSCGAMIDLGDIKLEPTGSIVTLRFQRPAAVAIQMPDAHGSSVVGMMQIVSLDGDGHPGGLSRRVRGDVDKVELVIPKLPVFVLVCHDRYRLERVLVDRTDLTVELRPGIPVGFEIAWSDPAGVTLPSGFRLEIQATLTDEALDLYSGQRIPVPGPGRQSITFPHAGLLEFDLVLFRAAVGAERMERSKKLPAALSTRSWTIIEQDLAQTVHLAIDSIIVTDAIDSLR